MDDIQTAYDDLLRATATRPPDAASLGARVRRRRARRRSRAVAAAALGVVLVAGGAVTVARQLGADPASTPSGPAAPTPVPTGSAAPVRPGWQRVSTPLSPRTDSLAVRVGGEVLFLGGAVDRLCPPNADCAYGAVYARDGAAYDPATGAWRPIAAAPVPIAGYEAHAVDGERLVLVTSDGAWREYDAAADAWTVLPDPPKGLRYPSVSAGDGVVYAVGQRGPVSVLDLATRSWSNLSAGSTSPALTGRTVTAIPAGVVVSGADATADNDGREPSYLLADVWDGTAWRRLPRTGQLRNYDVPWTWTGDRLVAVDPTCADGGEVDPYPSCLPLGGALDPESGRWAPLPSVPREPYGGGWSVVATADGSPLAAAYGYVYDDRGGTWTRLPRPDGAAEEPGGATWADGRLLVLGGVTWARGGARLSGDLWVWSP